MCPTDGIANKSDIIFTICYIRDTYYKGDRLMRVCIMSNSITLMNCRLIISCQFQLLLTSKNVSYLH